MATTPTKKQKAILDFMTKSFHERALYPTFREIGARFKISVGTVQDQIRALEAKGLVRRYGGVTRGLSLVGGLELPILGRVGAGRGPIAQEDVEGHLGFKDFNLGADFLLRVKGDSMVGANIVDGDLVQVRRQPNAEDGDIVVAIVGEEGVVKRLRRRGKAWRLESENPKYAPIAEAFEIVGKVLGLVRRYGGK